MRHDDSTDHTQSLLDSCVGAVFTPRNDGAFKHGQLVGTSIDVLRGGGGGVTEREREEKEGTCVCGCECK